MTVMLAAVMTYTVWVCVTEHIKNRRQHKRELEAYERMRHPYTPPPQTDSRQDGKR